ncbi:MAG: outer membrane protein assembly factor BamA, partial [Gammaproteobacteria bacterium]|nr:outer membrane protein assembly factor BamA [Gammaproteobacteria bacterium]
VLNYLPIAVGDTVDAGKLRSAMRSIYRAGFFEDVEFLREGNTLVVKIVERPSIADFNISGNREIETEDLERVLRSQGLTEGRIFDQSVLDRMKVELVRQYHSRGKYGVTVDTFVTDTGVNQVSISVVISEGHVAKIREINIVGNRAFADKKLKRTFELSTGTLFSGISGNNRYAREKLLGDLETLRSYYLDRGYADFVIQSAQVSVSPDKKGIYINIGVREGDVYTVKETQIVGEMAIPEEELRRFVLVQPNSTFSMAVATQTADLMVRRLNAEGYAFADVQPVPDLDRDNKEVTFTFFVDPGERVYVSRINFRGSSTTNEEVYRREMRQFEGAWLSSTNLDRSKVRLERLPWVESVEIDTNRVPGAPDLVDVDVSVEERSAGNFLFGVGFGGSGTGFFLSTS